VAAESTKPLFAVLFLVVGERLLWVLSKLERNILADWCVSTIKIQSRDIKVMKIFGIFLK
jgi:hypothetical protein